jgi:diguanylate cyclase (GGDEF)-like protein
MRGARILLVDDDRAMLTALTEMVRDCGFQALPASTWSEAIRVFRQSKPDLVLLDVMMPTIDGFKLARILKSENSEAFVPVILLTGLGDIESKRRGMASGADDFLTKPVTPVELEIRLSSMLRIKELTDQIQSANAKLAELAVTDALTLLHNRRSLNDALEREFARARRYKHSLAVYMLDIDHFKKVNDTHGHATGDRVLSLVAAVMRKSTRETDVVGRYGGEEFMILAPETSASDAHMVGERVRTKVESSSTAAADVPAVTISIGIATTDTVAAASVEELVQLADAALYQAKREGRNRCVAARPPDKPTP